jgi:hypothetical protein
MEISRRVLFFGKPGTGKTYTAIHSALDEGQKVYNITLTPDTPMAEIRGHFLQKGGDFVWHDGPGILAWREGARLVVNEIDKASEDLLTFLYGLMDDPDFAEYTLPTDEVVKPKKGFQVVATMNGEPEDLPDALQDRLPVQIEIKEMHPDAIATLPEDLQEAAKSTALAPTEARSISIRMWKEFALLREHIDDISVAAQAVFGEDADKAMASLHISRTASREQMMDGTDATKWLAAHREFHAWCSHHVVNGSVVTTADVYIKMTIILDEHEEGPQGRFDDLAEMDAYAATVADSINRGKVPFTLHLFGREADSIGDLLT